MQIVRQYTRWFANLNNWQTTYYSDNKKIGDFDVGISIEGRYYDMVYSAHYQCEAKNYLATVYLTKFPTLKSDIGFEKCI